ncbi:MAG TPA: ATP-binding protein [Stenotrophomonas sp.]|nr:ATP-binding protein [Stenotrophomonas sp.]
MSPARPPRRLSIFARTFLLLAGALVAAQGLGVALLLLRTPIFDVPVHPPEVVALLGTQMPAADTRLQVHNQSTMPQADAHQHREPRIEAMMAHWLGVPAQNVRFYTGGEPFGEGDRFMPPGGAAHLPPAGARDDSVATAGQAQGTADVPGPLLPGPPDFRNHGPPPGGYPAGGNPWRRGPGLDFIAGKNQFDGFTAAARQADGRWRVVTAPGRRLSGAFKLQVVLLLGAGLLLMLPLAWWFSRALSAPIRRFSEAADRLGRHPDAAPLSPQGPTELAQAVDSFNTMQARLSRMVHERTQMVAAIAHDLRTPLARLAFRVESVPAPLRERVMADIDEMKAMISAALDFIRNAQRPGPRSLLDFRLLAEGVVDDLCDIDADAQLLPGESVLLEGDPMGLRRMIANLCENALKYGGNVRLTLLCEDGHCLLWVDDDGPGIDPAQREQLLLPFVRGERSRNRDTGGIGLGLAVANGIATAHGGELWLDNRPEGGLRASVRLPCLPAARPAQ